MSTILDALRKSEQERNQNVIPTLNDMAAPQEPSRWPGFLGFALVLLALSLTVLAYVIWSSAEKPSSDSASQTKKLDPNTKSETAETELTIESTQIKELTKVNIVSYSGNDELRFAIVNGNMMREGEFIQPGLKLEKILPESVVFNLRGKKLERSP